MAARLEQAGLGNWAKDAAEEADEDPYQDLITTADEEAVLVPAGTATAVLATNSAALVQVEARQQNSALALPGGTPPAAPPPSGAGPPGGCGADIGSGFGISV